MASGKMSIPAQPVQYSSSPMTVGSTLQLSDELMNCRLISIWFGRYSDFGTAIVPLQKIKQGLCGNGVALLATDIAGWRVGISSTGLITLISIYGTAGEPNVEINGIN